MVTSTEYHCQADGHVERCGKAFVVRLRHYIEEDQTSCVSYEWSPICDYGTQINRSKYTSISSLELGRKPPGAILKENTRFLEAYSTLSSVQAKLIAFEHLKVLETEANHASQRAKESYNQHSITNRKHRPVFKIRAQVYIDTGSIEQKEKLVQLYRIYLWNWDL